MPTLVADITEEDSPAVKQFADAGWTVHFWTDDPQQVKGFRYIKPQHPYTPERVKKVLGALPSLQFDPDPEEAIPGVHFVQTGQKYSPDQERDDSGRWSSGGGVGTLDIPPLYASDFGVWAEKSQAVSAEEFQRIAEQGRKILGDSRGAASPTTGLNANWESIKRDAFAEAQKSWGGGTIDAHTGEPYTAKTGIAISVKEPGQETISVPENATYAEFAAAMDKAKEAFPQLENANMYLGYFHDDDSHAIHIDPSMIVKTAAEAQAVGAFTRSVGGGYDFATGDGVWPPHVKEAEAA